MTSKEIRMKFISPFHFTPDINTMSDFSGWVLALFQNFFPRNSQLFFFPCVFQFSILDEGQKNGLFLGHKDAEDFFPMIFFAWNKGFCFLSLSLRFCLSLFHPQRKRSVSERKRKKNVWQTSRLCTAMGIFWIICYPTTLWYFYFIIKSHNSSSDTCYTKK